MKALTFVTVACLAFTAFSTSLARTANPQAGRKAPGIDAGQKTQKERIKEGVKSSELTRREARQLAT